MIRIALISLVLSLSGCATIRNHPVATGVAVALIAGGIALSATHDSRVTPTRHYYHPLCYPYCAVQ